MKPQVPVSPTVLVLPVPVPVPRVVPTLSSPKAKHGAGSRKMLGNGNGVKNRARTHGSARDLSVYRLPPGERNSSPGVRHYPAQIRVKRARLAGGAVLLTPQVWSWGAYWYLRHRMHEQSMIEEWQSWDGGNAA